MRADQWDEESIWCRINVCDANAFRRQLKRTSQAHHLDIREDNPHLPDRVLAHRAGIEKYSAETTSVKEWLTYEGEEYPANLAEIKGAWDQPIRIAFPNLVVLEIDFSQAAYFMQSFLFKNPTPALRRIALRDCDDETLIVRKFPYEEFDLWLADRPEVKVVLLFHYRKAYFRNKLPLLNDREGLRGLESKYVLNPLPPPPWKIHNAEQKRIREWKVREALYDYEPCRDDPFGPYSMFRETDDEEMR